MQKIYILDKILLITKLIKMINKKVFISEALNLNNYIYIMYITYLK